MIAGAGLTTPIAYRWKTQINENAKLPAFAAELPELDHNEIVGWSRPPTSAASPPSSSTTPTRTRASRERIELTARADRARRRAACCASSRAARPRSSASFSLVLLGDLVSLYLAVLRGVDPTPVELLEQLKAPADAGLARAARPSAGPAQP